MTSVEYFSYMIKSLISCFLAVFLISATTNLEPAFAEEIAGPKFRKDGPSAEVYGIDKNYPRCKRFAYIKNISCAVGAFSQLDQLFPHNVIDAPKDPSILRRAQKEPTILYEFDGQTHTLLDYLDKKPVTGLLLAQGETILLERYQYDRNSSHRFTSFSMAKTIIGLLIGIAIEEGAIQTIDDLAETYVRELQGTPYGKTPIRSLLQMASGVDYQELPYGKSSDIAKIVIAAFRSGSHGAIAALRSFDNRLAEPGARFNYSSADSIVLSFVLTGATGKTVADYASEKLWKPLGAESDATWLVDGNGQEITFAYFNAVLRDWARLGLMLANKGQWQGKTIIPANWFSMTTTSLPTAPSPSYGYQVWLLPTKIPSFALRGRHGQLVLVAPEPKLVLVQTAVRSDAFSHQEIMVIWDKVLEEVVVD